MNYCEKWKFSWMNYRIGFIYEQMWHKGETGEPAAGSLVEGQAELRNMFLTLGRIVLSSDVILSPQAQRSWLNAVALENMDSISATLVTSHDERSWLKEEARSNILRMFTQLLTFHDEMSPLN